MPDTIRLRVKDNNQGSINASLSLSSLALLTEKVFFCEDDIVKESSGPKFAMYFTVTPVAERTSIAWTYVAKDYENIPDEETQQFEDMITLQDVPIVESQRPELLPLDLQVELHLRSDRTAIAYRKWLKQLGLTFGTS